MMKHALRSCPICREHNGEILHGMEFVLAAGSPLPHRYDVVACSRCAFVYADTPGKQADYDRYYAQFAKYDDPGIATGGGDSPPDRQRIDDTADILVSEFGELGRNARILDAGCARGGLLRALASRGYRHLHGLDPSPACVDYLRQSGFGCTLGTLSTAVALAGAHHPFDAVILSHVLEHVVDLESTMHTLRGLLSPQGLLYIEVPDAGRYVEHPMVPFYYFDCEHINHFDTDSLRNLASRCGFIVGSHGSKDIVLENGRRYPATWVCLKPGEGPRLAPAARLRASVGAYIALCRDSEDDPALLALSRGRQPVVLWGAGSYAQRLLAGSRLADCRIVAVVDRDNNKQGGQFAGHTVIAPEYLPTRLKGDEVIVIAAAIASDTIVCQIAALGLSNPVVQPGAANSKLP